MLKMAVLVTWALKSFCSLPTNRFFKHTQAMAACLSEVMKWFLPQMWNYSPIDNSKSRISALDSNTVVAVHGKTSSLVKVSLPTSQLLRQGSWCHQTCTHSSLRSLILTRMGPLTVQWVTVGFAPFLNPVTSTRGFLRSFSASVSTRIPQSKLKAISFCHLELTRSRPVAHVRSMCKAPRRSPQLKSCLDSWLSSRCSQSSN